MIDNDRSQWTVSTQSYSYRLYQWWFRMSAKGPLAYSPPRPIDLCHYMRVILIWVWLRWFFTSHLLPWLWTGIVAFLGINAWFWSMWPEQMKTVFQIYATVIVFAAIVGLLSLLAPGHRWEKTGQRLDAFCERQWKRAKPHFVKFGDNVIVPFGKWFFMRSFFWRIYPWMVVFVGLIIALAILFPYDSLIVLLYFLGIGIAFLCLIGLVALLSWGEDRYKTKQMNKKLAAMDEPATKPEVSQKHEFLRLIWQYIVSRKHRICPFIVPTNGPTATPRER